MLETATQCLYNRLGGYDAIVAVVESFLPRLQADEELKRFWMHRGIDGVNREKQLLIDFLCASAGGPVYYTGREMKLTHAGMKIRHSDWERMVQHLTDTLDAFEVPTGEKNEVLGLVACTKADIVELP